MESIGAAAKRLLAKLDARSAEQVSGGLERPERIEGAAQSVGCARRAASCASREELAGDGNSRDGSASVQAKSVPDAGERKAKENRPARVSECGASLPLGEPEWGVYRLALPGRRRLIGANDDRRDQGRHSHMILPDLETPQKFQPALRKQNPQTGRPRTMVGGTCAGST